MKPIVAPDVVYPEIVPAPPSGSPPHPFYVKGQPAGAVDQTYPEIVPAPPVSPSHRCPHCGGRL